MLCCPMHLLIIRVGEGYNVTFSVLLILRDVVLRPVKNQMVNLFYLTIGLEVTIRSY